MRKKTTDCSVQSQLNWSTNKCPHCSTNQTNHWHCKEITSWFALSTMFVSIWNPFPDANRLEGRSTKKPTGWSSKHLQKWYLEQMLKYIKMSILQQSPEVTWCLMGHMVWCMLVWNADNARKKQTQTNKSSMNNNNNVHIIGTNELG